MDWKTLNSEAQFLDLLNNEPLFVVFKHSTRCSISSMAKNRLEREWDLELPVYYLDLLQYRSVSNLIAEKSSVEHQSPQLIVFQNGLPIYDASHSGIVTDEVKLLVLINIKFIVQNNKVIAFAMTLLFKLVCFV